jgi:4-amino-4-deoxy-L-arabinose transferase-like glycosyltransferase
MSTTTLPRRHAGERPDERRSAADRLRAFTRGDVSDPAWARPALLGLLSLTALAYILDLTASGNANTFYAAAVQAGTKSWKAFFFGSLDSSSFITVDKPPASLWVMALSGRIFGFSSASMLVPQVLEGVAAVALLHAAIKRWFGAGAGLLAGATLAITPVAALMFRFNNPDALLVCLLVAAAYCLVRALETATTRWLVAVGTLLGFAFLTKMLQAFLVLPGFTLVYAVAAPAPAWRRVRQLLIGGLAVLVSCGWWLAIVALWPASSRPMIDGSPDNNIFNLIFGYNGLGRIFGASGGAGGGGGATFSLPAVQRPDGRPGLVAAARVRARIGLRPLVDAPSTAHRPHPRGAHAVGRLAGRHRWDLQFQQRRDPYLLHGCVGTGNRRAGRDRRCACMA